MIEYYANQKEFTFRKMLVELVKISARSESSSEDYL